MDARKKVEITEKEMSLSITDKPSRTRTKRPHNSVSRKRYINKIKRMAGMNYVGFSSKNKKIRQDTLRNARAIGSPCASQYCIKRTGRSCNLFDEKTRRSIFESFWEKTWDAKREFVKGLLKESTPKRPSSENSRKKAIYKYYLNLNEEQLPIQVCQKMFLSTLGLKADMAIGFTKNKSKGSLSRQIRHLQKTDSAEIISPKTQHLMEYFTKIPKAESHYYRKDSQKQYIEATWRTKTDVYRDYKKVCETDNRVPLSYFSFAAVFDDLKLSVYTPRKDQCDICVSYKAGLVSQSKYEIHIRKQQLAKADKLSDKMAAIATGRHVFTMDVQAVKLCPDLNASAIYFKQRLQNHNFTVFNLATHDCTNHWWNETEGDMSASSFVTCIIDYLEENCLSDTLPITMFSDGCGYQNRNQYLSNALSNFAIQHDKIIEQKFLEKGHTQMEVDSVHAKIEKKLKNHSIYIPEDYVKVTLDARQTVTVDNNIEQKPFKAKYVTHEYFKDYTDPDLIRFSSIRPGNKKTDPKVHDIRALMYLPNGKVKYKIDFNDEYKDLPIEINKYKTGHRSDLWNQQIKITQNKWKHLQSLKEVIPAEFHEFYDNLPVVPPAKKTVNVAEPVSTKNLRVCAEKDTSDKKSSGKKFALKKTIIKPKNKKLQEKIVTRITRSQKK